MSEETKTPEIDPDAFAKKVAEETAAKIAIRQVEEKAAAEQAAAEEIEKAAEAAEAKAQQEEEVQAAIKVGVESGADRLMADMEAKMQEKDADPMAKVVAEHQEVLKEKQSELDAMRESKRVFLIVIAVTLMLTQKTLCMLICWVYIRQKVLIPSMVREFSKKPVLATPRVLSQAHRMTCSL